ncbi:tail fiber domain-containing protein [Bacteroides congonensis]|uniref:tail fiber domain-containing protein n=1 Tax=Bacteroides congonensis TaxID=1871006 RepID=UPI000934212C|nr:tail fiber domain-containing protein [Bacteroides congonensis]
MEIKTNYIPHNFRNKYLKNTGGYASSSSSNVSTGNGLPYTLDENGNYVVEKQVLFKKSIISKEEVVAYGEDNVDYVGTYAPLSHPHGIDDITGLQEILDNIEGGTGGASIEVIDNLDSVSSTAALSARQGKILSDLISDKSSVSSWNDIKDKPTTFPPSTHNHTVTEITGLQSQLDGKASSSHSHVISGITGLSTELGNKANVNHSHSISGITNLQNQLDSKAASSHTHSISAITNLTGELNKKSNTGHTHTVSDITNLKEGLPYTVDSAGNYVIDKKVIFNETIVSKGEVVAYGEDDKKYVATYAPFTHSHTVDDVTGLQEILDNIEGGSGGTIEVIDNLDSVSSTAALSAKQGKILSDLISDKTVTWDTLQNKPATFTPSAHSHAISGITGLQTQLDSKAASSHTHTIANISNLQSQLDSKASASHTHAISAVTNLQAELNKKSDTAHTHDNRYYTETEVNNLLAAKASSSHTHTIANVTGLQGQLDGKSNNGHTHDDRYYTETEINSLLSGKTNNGHTHTIANVTGLQGQLDSKASSSHTHTIANVTNLQTELNKKSDTAHTHDSRYYTETEVNNLLATKASSSHTHTIANITNLQIELNNKSNINHTHAISGVTGLQTQLDSKVNTSSLSTLSVKNSDTVDNLHAASFMRSDTDTTCSGTITCANLVSTGEVTAYSDRRLKTDIQALNNRGLLNPVVYTKDNKKQIGFIAQEVQEVYPELITEDVNGYLSLNYQQLTAVLSSQINDLYSIINELKLEISKLKK